MRRSARHASSGPDVLFTYGTLQLPDVLEAIAAIRPPSLEAVLCDHVRRRVRGRSFPGLAPHLGSRVAGRAYLGIAARCWELLDRFEGPLYERRVVTVATSRGDHVDAQCYVVREEHRGELADEDWDLERFARTDLDGFLTACRAFAADPRRHAGADEAPRPS